MKQFILFFLLMLLPVRVAAQETITGYAIDDVTGDSLGFVTVQYKGQKLNTVCDHRGYFSIPKHVGWKLSFSAVGYKTRTITVEKGTHRLLLALKPDNKMLGEVTVKTKRSRYRRKNNPAVELMRKVIEHKKKTELSLRDYYQYTKYQKLKLALNNITPDMLTDPQFAKHPWLTGQVEKCDLTGKLILPLCLDETVTQTIYRKSPHDEKDIVQGKKSTGINKFIQTGDIVNVGSKDIFTDINIYDDQIRILQHPFTSPIGKGAISFYRYYIEDTLKIDRDSCIHLHFLPNNQQDFGFRGDLYILKDSSYQVKRCEMILPNQTDVNFVESLRMIQEFSPLPTGEWVLTADDLVVELVMFEFAHKGVAIRSTRLTDYSFDPIPDKLFKGKAKTATDPYADMQGDDFWNEHRKVDLTKSEKGMDDFMNGIRGLGFFKYALFALKLVSENFIETSDSSKVDIGPVTSMISSNFIDGLRLRVGAQTTGNLSHHLFLKGFLARGFKSKNTYYKGNVTWSFNHKRYLPDEFPRHQLSFTSAYDVCSPSDKFLEHDKDNVFTSFKWAKVDKMMFYSQQHLAYEREEPWGLRSVISIKTERDDAAASLRFTPLSETKPGSFTSTLYPNWTDEPPSIQVRTTELKAELEYSPNALYSNIKLRRVKINREAPIFKFSHTFGLKGFLGGDYDYNYTEASIFKRFWLSSWGRIDLYTRAGLQWNQVPFILLCQPAANFSYISQKQTFNLINNLEFMNDRFWSVDVNWDMQGKIFNRIPLIRKARLREYIGAKMLWGGLSDKNNPTLPQNADNPILMAFPEGSFIMNPKVPYWEISLGIRGIFRFFQVEYVRRMNYNDHPNVTKNSVRFGFTMMF